jgi:hypothetical protein
VPETYAARATPGFLGRPPNSPPGLLKAPVVALARPGVGSGYWEHCRHGKDPEKAARNGHAASRASAQIAASSSLQTSSSTIPTNSTLSAVTKTSSFTSSTNRPSTATAILAPDSAISAITPTLLSLWQHAQAIAKQKLPQDEWTYLDPSPEDTIEFAIKAAEEAQNKAKEKR